MKKQSVAPHAKVNLRINAWLVDKASKKTRISASNILIELADGGRMLIPLVGLPNNRVLGLATGSIASREKDDHSRFVIYPGCSNVVYLHVEDDRKKETLPQPTRRRSLCRVPRRN